MSVRRAIQHIWRLTGVPARRSTTSHSIRRHPELPRVNAIAGTEPIRPELSGLRLRRPSEIPRRAIHLLIRLAYLWQPSEEYRRRQSEMRWVNTWQRALPRKKPYLPPIYRYLEDTDINPIRQQPPAGRPGACEDLSDLEAAERPHRPGVIYPRITEANPEYLRSYSPLLPGRYRRFLLSSLYGRVLIGITLGVMAIAGYLWLAQTQRAEAVAAGRYRVVRSKFQSELDAAQVYGMDHRTLQRLQTRSRSLSSLTAPFSLSGGRVRFYHDQERRYAALLRTVHHLERSALRHWTWQEGVTRASLVESTREANDLGLRTALPAIRACPTPRCYRELVARQDRRIAWLRQTASTLRSYRNAVAASSSPATGAAGELQVDHALQAILPHVPLPTQIPALDGMYAVAATPRDYARVGALAHLDADALQADLVRTLPHRAIVISTEGQSLTCYQGGKAVKRSPVTTGVATPTGVFHLQAKQPSIATLFWSRGGGRYRYGSLPDWMPFSGSAALQAAPWRTVFGPGSQAAPPAYAPSTPASIDLPPAVAKAVFRWASVGTEIVVY